MINIILCDDHEIVRKGLRQIIQEQPGFFVLADVPSGEMLLKVLRKSKPEVIILDIALSGRSGLEVLKQIKLLYPKIKVLVLSMYPEDQFALRTIKAGASGYLHKDSPPAVLTEAVRTIAEGGKYVSQQIMTLLFSEIASAKNNFPLHKALSDREFEVMLMLGQEKKISEIADSMSLSIKTVSTYKTRIYEKLNLKTQGDVNRYLSENNLLKAV